VVKNLEKEMKIASMEKNYEKAAAIRDRLFAVRHLGEVSAISEEHSGQNLKAISYKLSARIEAYDISHISGAHAVGSMVVFNNGPSFAKASEGLRPDKSQYRKFKIKTITGIDDYQMMAEVISRRLNHKEWPLPDLIVIDGGRGHLNVVEKLLAEKNIDIPIIAIAKGPSRKGLQFFYNKKSNIKNQISNNIFKKIIAEAHRFALGYHHQKSELDLKEQVRQYKKSKSSKKHI
jgi:excinuclease ABC subunit C